MAVDTDAQRRLLDRQPLTLYMRLQPDELWPLYDAVVSSPSAPKRLLRELRGLIGTVERQRERDLRCP